MVFVFKIKIILQVILFLLIKRIQFLFLQIFRSRQFQDNWVNSNVVGWGHKCCGAVSLKCKTDNYELLERLDWSRNVFLVANHQSYMDIAAIYVSTRRMFGFLAKYELSWVPFLSFWMKIQGCVFINRAKFISAIKTLKNLEKNKKSIRLVLFPEGTRSKTGKPGKFKTGALKIAWALDGLLIATHISGTREAWENRDIAYKDYPAEIRFDKIIDLKETKKIRTFDEFFKELENFFASMNKIPQ
jgi:1-acyl-sn-glycerol-3-phosphate acyltransferase